MTTVDISTGVATTTPFCVKLARGQSYVLHGHEAAVGYWSGAQDAAQNTYTLGDFVYVVNGVANRIYANTAPATVGTGAIGVVVGIVQPQVNGEQRQMDAVTFTAAAELTRCSLIIWGPGIQMNGTLLKVGDSATHAPIPFVWATHAVPTTSPLYGKLALRNSALLTVEVI